MKWEKLAQLSLDMICTFDRDGFYTYASEASMGMLGYESAELVGRHFTALLHPDDLEKTNSAFQTVLHGAKSKDFENRLVHKQGNLVPVLWSSALSEEDGTIYCVVRDITELEAGRRRLEESEHRYRALFENNPDIVYLENCEGLLLEVNKGFCDMWGISAEEAIHQPSVSFLPAEAVSSAEEALQQVLRGNTIREDLEMVKGNKKLVFHTIQYPVMVNGEVIGAQTIARDITSTVLAYQTIQSQAMKLNNILESITDAFLTLDKDWRITYFNKEAEQLLPFDRAKHLGVNIWDLFPEEVGGPAYLLYHQAIATGKTTVFTTFLVAHNKWFQVKAYPSGEGLSIYFDDVTEKVNTQGELEKLSLVASKSNNGMLIIDKDGVIEWVNEGFSRLHGYGLEEAVGKRPFDLLHHPTVDVSLYKSLNEKLGQGESVSFEILNRTKSGEGLWVSVEISPVFDEAGNITQFVVVQTDISALKQSEQELTKLANDLYRQKSDLQQFSYIISHNLRGPVANALGLTDLLMEVPSDTVVFSKSLRFLQQSVKKLDAVLMDVNTILGVRDSKGNLEVEQVDILNVLEQALSSFKEPLSSTGAKVIIDVEEDMRVRANKAYLHSIFYNLLSNSIKYRSEERSLEIRVKCFEYAENRMVISFSDNGTGFDMDKAKDNIFKLYKRFHTEQEGRGMGLFLIKSHLDAMDGHVEVTSRVGEGTKFMLFLSLK
ncbi:PAS domain S-box protein [Rufibacter glacialis]|uniref:histidine kinase n=1 Tax=Rufibacter glacialis TaxID=1259555 RepID=A0A5M8QJP2_9BACT|nr:PAS domain S-box protein [Rufibacter glacialis]KAA6435488.1 PAS domain S-box protein [Rufibacter glacialis]GGK63928.1 hypothetical protein GCM10011405_09920 [Rufibacter glacialis]